MSTPSWYHWYSSVPAQPMARLERASRVMVLPWQIAVEELTAEAVTEQFEQAGGMAKPFVLSVVELLRPHAASVPRPRLAKAVQARQQSALGVAGVVELQPVWTASRKPERASQKVGLQAARFMPSSMY